MSTSAHTPSALNADGFRAGGGIPVDALASSFTLFLSRSEEVPHPADVKPGLYCSPARFYTLIFFVVT